MDKKDHCQVHEVHIDTKEFKNKADEVSGLSELFKVLADETRTKIIYLLSLRELCTCDLSEILGITLPSVSHHLRLLKAFRIVKYRREGKTVFYSLSDKHVLDLINVAKEHFEEFLEG
ncbi:ArsR family transcriptional regulator [Kosmotoga arenicorallina S304]|uniref:ArsR family transcriptional regulator n=1 Tax=Kosmotoga arenicorallina S304 TaxID=1453497 RepID=A0A176K0L9_9BACT|nr:metalloregulator ArsR/SmtB family transcription factor [Kosmotoga arenicorallina]OAA30044.1 ArsR family transcriptional regulator [Kosmotoga arenicorallina S304]